MIMIREFITRGVTNNFELETLRMLIEYFIMELCIQ
jgi:hypothetical protein